MRVSVRLCGLVLGAAGVAACTSSSKPLTSVPYRQDFASPSLGPEWSTASRSWQVIDGRLYDDGAHNVPLWLSAALPNDVRVSFVAESKSPAVDLKFEIFGDGRRHSSGYVVILSGWKNTKSIIARLDEHGPVRTSAGTTALEREVATDAAAAAARHADRREIVERSHRGTPNHPYRLRCERRGRELTFYVDDVEHLRFYDPSPLGGPGHDRFAFSNWASEVFFDDLLIEAL